MGKRSIAYLEIGQVSSKICHLRRVLVLDGLEGFLRPRHEHDVMLVFYEPLRDGEANTAASASYNDNLGRHYLAFCYF